MHCRNFIGLIYFFISILGYGQSSPVNSGIRANLIKDQLYRDDLKKIEKLEKQEKEALYLMWVSDINYEVLGNVGQQIEAEKNKKKRERLFKKSARVETKAIQKRIESLKLYHEIFVQRYKIYKKDLKKFFPISDDIKVDSATILEKLAYDAFAKADVDVERVYYTINPTDLFKIFTRAYQSEQLGLLYQEKMYSFFLDWNDTINVRLDKEILAFLHNEPVEQKPEGKTIKPVKDSIIIKTIIVYDTVRVNYDEVQIEKKDVVIYKIQIAASKMVLSAEKLNNLYPSLHYIDSELENGWYKYTIGYFTHYQDAQRFKINSGVPGSFIIAYKNGKRIPLSELANHPSYISEK